jgi:hypothetical protein
VRNGEELEEDRENAASASGPCPDPDPACGGLRQACPGPPSALIADPALELVGFMLAGFGVRDLVRGGYLVSVEPDILARWCPNSSLARRRV